MMTFAEWLRELFEEHSITSSRQGRIRTGISHTTLEDILSGTRQPSVESTVRIAEGFHKDPIYALRLAGHEDIAKMLEGRSGSASAAGSGGELTYETSEDAEELMSYYDGMPPNLKPVAKATLKAMRDSAIKANEPTTYGKRAE